MARRRRRERPGNAPGLSFKRIGPSTWATVVIPLHQSQQQTSGLGGSQLSGLPLGPGKAGARSRSWGRRCCSAGTTSPSIQTATTLRFAPPGEMLETWDIRTARRVSTLGQGAGGVAASPDGRWLGRATESYEALWSSQTGSRVFSLPQESGAIWSRALSPDGERLAVGSADGGLAIWNVPKIQAQLAQIGLAWRADARPPRAAGTAAFRARDAP